GSTGSPDLLDRRDLDERGAMFEVEVPSVVPPRIVVVQLEHVARPAQHLAPDLLVEDRRQQPTLVPLHAEQLVLHRPVRNLDALVVDVGDAYRPTAGWRLDAHRLSVELADLRSRMRGRVEESMASARAGDDGHGRLADVACALGQLPEIALRLFVDPIDAGAGQDIVELVEQQRLPQGFEVAGGVSPAGGNRPYLGLTQRVLRNPVPPLGARLAGVSATMALEVQLAGDSRQVVCFGWA